MTDLFQAEGTPQVDETKDYLVELVGEGKKFKTVQDLARGKYQADLHIDLLERTKDQLRADYLKLQDEALAGAKLKELVDQARANQGNPASSNHTPANVDTQRPSYDPKELDSIVDSKLEQRELAKKESNNFKIVHDKLKERLGSQYQEVLKQQIAELHLTSDYVNGLARTSPEAFFRVMGLNETVQNDNWQAPVRGNQRPSTSGSKVTDGSKTWSQWQELKKTNPAIYQDTKTVLQMERDYAKLGKAFEDGDYMVYNQRSSF